MEQVIDIKKVDTIDALLGDLARKKYNYWKKLSDGTIKKYECYSDTETMEYVLGKYSKYLTGKKLAIILNIYKTNWKKILKGNAFAIPAHLLSLVITLNFPLITNEILSFFVSSLVMGISSLAFVVPNLYGLYANDLETKEIEELNQRLEICHEMQKENINDMQNKEKLDLERARLLKKAHSETSDIKRILSENKKEWQQVEKNVKAITRPKVEIHYNPNFVSDVPEYLKKGRGR